jgi:hypothetical protein
MKTNLGGARQVGGQRTLQAGQAEYAVTADVQGQEPNCSGTREGGAQRRGEEPCFYLFPQASGQMP